jgi:hypothetical protein
VDFFRKLLSDAAEFYSQREAIASRYINFAAERGAAFSNPARRF